VPALLRLAKSGAAGRREMLESGNAAVLLRHAAAGDEAAARALLLLTLDGDDARVGLVADGAVDALSAAVRRGGAVAALAATALTSLATVDVNKCSIGAHPSAIPELVGLLRRGGPRERREAATTLYDLCKLTETAAVPCARAPRPRSPTSPPSAPPAPSRCSASSPSAARGASSCESSRPCSSIVPSLSALLRLATLLRPPATYEGDFQFRCLGDRSSWETRNSIAWELDLLANFVSLC